MASCLLLPSEETGDKSQELEIQGREEGKVLSQKKRQNQKTYVEPNSTNSTLNTVSLYFSFVISFSIFLCM